MVYTSLIQVLTYDLCKKYKSYEKDILKIFNEEIVISEISTNDILLFVQGYYYENKQNYEKMEKYYLLSGNLGNIYSSMYLGFYYKEIKEYEKMKQYFLLSGYSGNVFAIVCLGYHYEEIKDYDQMKKYYLMAVDLNSIDGMVSLTLYYGENKKEFYNLLNSVENKNNLINNKLKTLNYEIENNMKFISVFNLKY